MTTEITPCIRVLPAANPASVVRPCWLAFALAFRTAPYLVLRSYAFKQFRDSMARVFWAARHVPLSVPLVSRHI